MKHPNILRSLVGIATLWSIFSATTWAATNETMTVTGNWQVTITDLGVLPGGSYASAYGINVTGKIVGVAADATGALKTVQWVNGQISIIPDLGGGLAVPEDLNDAGEIAGGQTLGGFLHLGIYWDSQNNPFLLPGLPNASSNLVRAHAINSSGQVVGMAQEVEPNFFGHAAVWLKNLFQTDLGFMGGGTYSEAYGINDLGHVVGIASVANTNQHAFLWQNGQFTDLSTWTGGGAASIAYAINNNDVIVGLNSSVASVWQNGAVQRLPMPTGISAFTPAIDINDAGDIIATGSKGYPNEVGVLWRNGEPIDLGTLPGGTISRARRINAAGEIVGEANTPGFGPFHAVKWTVTPVDGNTAPAVTLAASSATKIRRGGSVSFHGTFADPDTGDGPWTYTWVWGNGSTGGTATAPGSIDATHTYPLTGTYKVSLVVKDARGASGTSNVITVRVR